MDARVDYYKAISKAEKENKETKIKAETSRRTQEIQYFYALAVNKLKNDLKAIEESDEDNYYDYYYYYYTFAGSYSLGYFYEDLQITLGDYWYNDYYYDQYYSDYYYYGYYYDNLNFCKIENSVTIRG